MDYQTIELVTTDGVAVVTLNRPDKMNSMNSQMRAEITHALRESGQDARVIVLTGAGRAFCTGQDLGDGTSAASLDLERVLRDEYTPMIRAIAESPVPTIAAVNGPAAGAGASLALACDVAIASESAYFLQAFALIGLLPDAGSTWILPRNMGLARAMGAALFADRIGARQAADWGMVWEAVADDAFTETWKGRAATLAKGPTLGYGAIKQALRASFGNAFEDQLTLEAQLQGKAGKSRDFQEGVLAFMEKRKASFEGR